MATLITDNLLKVVTVNGQHLLETPSGERIKGLIFTRVYDGPIKGDTYVIAKIKVNLENSK